VLAAYKPSAPQTGYLREDHPNLISGASAALFDLLRKEVLALDPCVTEHYLKLYIAFKAETNFVDVIPQAKRLRLSLNIGIHEIEDPREMCRNVEGVGRWGNGDVELYFAAEAELPYVIGLVRQALEKQLGK
jgi:predicted transport protein